MKILVTKITVDNKGHIVLPAGLAGPKCGDEIQEVLAVQGNGNAPLLRLTSAGIEVAVTLHDLPESSAPENKAAGNELHLPDKLLAMAGIPKGCRLGAFGGDGCITFYNAEEDDDEDEILGENDGIHLPADLLEDASMPPDSDLDIIRGDGAIIILSPDILGRLPEELTELFQELSIHPDTVREVMGEAGYFA